MKITIKIQRKNKQTAKMQKEGKLIEAITNIIVTT